jgi:hypothetical protein
MDTISKEKIIAIKKKDVGIKGDALVITFRGKQYHFPFNKLSKKLLTATKTQRDNFKVSPSGYGIHRPELDEDLAFAPMLKEIGAL